METLILWMEDIKQNFAYILLILLSATLIGYYVKLKVSRRRYTELVLKIPYLPNMSRLPLLGYLHHFIGTEENALNTIIDMASKVTVNKIYMGPFCMFLVTNPEDVKTIFNSPQCMNKGDFYQLGKSIVGQGLALSQGARWKKHKKLLSPSFSQKKLDNNIPIFNANLKELLKVLETQSGTFDFLQLVSHCTLCSIVETTMGIKLNIENDGEFEKNLDRITILTLYRGLNLLIHPEFIYRLTPNYREEKKLQKYFRDFTLKVINERKAIRKNNAEKPSSSMFLDDLLEINEQSSEFTDEEIMDEVNTFLVAGNDTNAYVASYLILSLALHPNIQQKVFEEAIEILGPDKEVEADDLPKFTYLECVLKESMRLFTLAPIVSRSISEDLQLGSYTLPKGGEVIVPIIGIHRSPKFFPDPLKFDPNRFLPEESAKRHPYTFIPFTNGMRMCIGYKYAYMFLKVLAANIVRKFIIETDYKSVEEIKFEYKLIMSAKDGCPIRLKSRKMSM